MGICELHSLLVSRSSKKGMSGLNDAEMLRIYCPSIPEMAARYGEPCSFRAAIRDIGTSTVAKAAPRPMERHPIITRLVRALRLMGKSPAIPISTKMANIGESIHEKSPSTTTIAVSTTLRGVPIN